MAVKTPICNTTIEGPIVKDGGRSRPLWRRGCQRKVKFWGDHCYQHGGPNPRADHDRPAADDAARAAGGAA